MVIIYLLATYFALTLVVFIFQRRMIYHPTKESLTSLQSIALSFGFEPWHNDSGQFIGWKHLEKNGKPCRQLLITHGNAGNAFNRLDYADGLRQVEPWDVYILEYPGYGPRPGPPSQTRLFAAAREAMELLNRQGAVYLMGESLGTGVACYLAGTYPQSVKGVLLVAPYNMMVEVARVHMKIFPARLLLRDRFTSATYLKLFHGPVGILLAGRDVIVPCRFGRKLFEGYHSHKRVWEMPDAGHNDLLDHETDWWRELIRFWDTHPAA